MYIKNSIKYLSQGIFIFILMSQEDLNQLSKTLLDILEPDNEKRKAAEAQLNALISSRKEDLILCLSQLLLTPDSPALKKLICVVLSKLLSIQANLSAEVSLWAQLGDRREPIKANLLKSFLAEKDAFVCKKLSDLICNVAELSFDAEEKWDALIGQVVNDLQGCDPSGGDTFVLETRIYLFSKVLSFFNEELPNCFSQVVGLFEKCFLTKNLKLKTKVVNTIIEMMYVADKKEKKTLKGFVMSIMRTAYECLEAYTTNEEDLRHCVMALSALVDICPEFLKKNFNDFFILLGKISEEKRLDESTIREMSFDIVTTLIGKKPSIFKKDKDTMGIFIHSLFKYSFEMEDLVTEEWLNPPTLSYLDEDIIPEEQVEAALSQVSRLISYLGFPYVMDILSPTIMELLAKEDNWKFKYIGFITISQIIEHVSDLKSIENIIEIILANVPNDHPKIRYACMQCIEQISDHLQPLFQNNYHTRVFAILTERFGDQCLRNRLQALETMQSFLEHCRAEKIFSDGKYIKELLDSLFGLFLREDIPVSQRESILHCCSELVEVTGDLFSPYAERCLTILLDFFSKVFSNTQYKSLFGSLIEIVSLVGPKCQEVYLKYIPDLVTAMIAIQDNIPKSTDVLFENLKGAWESIIPMIKDHYSHLLPKIVESNLRLIVNSPKAYLEESKAATTGAEQGLVNISELLADQSGVSIKKEKKKELSTSETEDYAGAIELLNKVIKAFGTQYIPYISTTEQAIAPLLSFELNHDIRIESSNTLLEIISSLAKSKETNSEELAKLSKVYIAHNIVALQKESNNSAISTMLDNIGSILEEVNRPILDSNEIKEISTKFLQTFDKVKNFRSSLVEKKKLVEENIETEKKSRLQGPKDASDEEEDSDEDEEFKDELQKDLEEIEDVLVSIADLFSSIFKTHRPMTNDMIDIVNKLRCDLLPKYFKPNASTFEKKMGLFILDDMVEHLGQELLADIWQEITNLIAIYISHKEHCLRQASAYGLGEVARNTKVGFQENFNDLFFECFTRSLGENPFSDQDDEKKDEWGAARDNITVAVGKILKHQYNAISTNTTNLERWVRLYLDNLPIKYDDDEAPEQHEIFLVLVKSNTNVMVGNENCNLPRILLILAEVYGTKLLKEEHDKEVSFIVDEVRKNPHLAQSYTIASQMCKDKNVLKKLSELFKQ